MEHFFQHFGVPLVLLLTCLYSYFFTECSRVCVETIIDAAMTCLDLGINSNDCFWDIIIEYVVCASCACQIIENIVANIFGQDLDLC